MHIGEVFTETLYHLQKLPFPIDLSSLTNIEKSICEKFGANDFSNLGNGSFLSFLISNQKLIKEMGGGVMGAGHGVEHAAVVKEKIFRIIDKLRHEFKEDEVSLVHKNFYKGLINSDAIQ